MTSPAHELADWAASLTPTADDLALADRALLDTVAVAVAAREHPVTRIASDLPDAARWAVAGHVLDFDDLHMASTTHVSVVCVPSTLATGGDARAYLAGAGVMARLGTALGWPHYSAGWHATCTAGAPAAAVAAGTALGLDAGRLADAIALALPAAGGVQLAFGSDTKSLQVGFAAEAGVRAAALAAAGATADPGALEQWIDLVGGDPAALDLGGPAVPGGLAIKVYPCCYALQRPISALADLARDGLDPATVTRVVLRTPRGTVAPLTHHRPQTGLQAKFSLEYAAAAALLDTHQGFASFTDEAVRRPEAQRLVELVEVELSEGGDWLLAGELEAQVHTGATVRQARLRLPPGSPDRPPTREELATKVADCLAGTDVDPSAITWPRAADILRRWF
ncbi:MmgE/PrpD family protein [Pedococcus sp. NPDC057267]|uniref:MmgE/PrpD family protein n=1 Tax=Pedococcus sp. NPDC057267 TaxID=3346077 RepID=UPI0036295225